MSSRRNLRAAVRWILPAVIVVAAGSAPPLHAQSEATPVPGVAPDTALACSRCRSTRAAKRRERGVRRTRHARRADDGAETRRRPSTPSIETIVPGAQMVVPAGSAARRYRHPGERYADNEQRPRSEQRGSGVRCAQHAGRAHDGADPGQPACRRQSDAVATPIAAPRHDIDPRRQSVRSWIKPSPPPRTASGRAPSASPARQAAVRRSSSSSGSISPIAGTRRELRARSAHS